MKFTSEIINKLPKAELHCHLDGSLRIKTIIELAEIQGVELPSKNEDDLLKIYVESSDPTDAETAQKQVAKLYNIMSTKIQSECIETLPLLATGKKNYKAFIQGLAEPTS